MVAKTYRSKKAKGRSLEKEVAKRLRQVLGDDHAVNMPLSGGGSLKGDVYTQLPISIECKKQERVQIWEFWEQARQQASTGKMPVLCLDRNYNKDVLSVLRFEDLLTLMDFAIQGGWVSYFPKR